MRPIPLIWLLLWSVAVPTTGVGEADRSQPPTRFPLPFADEAPRIPELARAREQLLRAIAARNREDVLRLVEPSLAERLKLTLTPNAREWDELRKTLSLGGAFTARRGGVPGREEFCAPYVYSNYPKPVPEPLVGELDPWAVVGDHVSIRAAPRSEAKTHGTLSYELVKVTGNAYPGTGSPRWIEVQVHGRPGWVEAERLRAPEDYHACFARFSEEWRLVVFSHGSTMPW